jgi:hypothetical protein
MLNIWMQLNALICLSSNIPPVMQNVANPLETVQMEFQDIHRLGCDWELYVL